MDCPLDLAPSLTHCPVTAAVDVIGGKWKPLIVWNLMQRTHRFGELRRALPTVTQQMLTAQLRELETAGIVHREVYREVPPKVEYSLTPMGKGLGDLLSEMVRWGETYLAAKRSDDAVDAPMAARS